MKITVNARYARAVNVERDGIAATVGNYILTVNARRLLRRIAEEAAVKKTECAWTLAGSYGVGKSAFALYLSALLAGAKSAHGAAARQLCLQEDKSLAQVYAKLSAADRGFCPVFITGARELMAPRLLSRLADSLDGYFDGKPPPVVAALRTAAKKHAPPSAVAGLLRRAADAVYKGGGSGLFVVIDEMGKFLEYDADNPNSDNAYMLQMLAEITTAHGKKSAQVWLLGVLHHNFGYYTRGLSDDARAEWTKVAGRFSQAVFAETPEQMLRLAARVIQHDIGDKDAKVIRRDIAPLAKMIFDSGFLGERAFAGDIEGVFAPCYPLHPFSAVLLILLSEKMGQNERTLFDYLAGGHPFGFMRGIGQLRGAGDFIMPWALYDYFADSGGTFSADSLMARRRAEIDDALRRLGADAPAEQGRMLKTIALFNIAGARNKFSASGGFLAALFGKKAKAILAALGKRSLITYRRFADEYRVWQGSDFDLDAALRYRKNNAPFYPAEELNNIAVPPLIAHRHAILTGNIRRLPLLFVDGGSEMEKADEPRMIVYLAKGEEKAPATGGNDLLIIGRGGDALEGILKERRALEEIVDLPDLESDSVARAEVNERLAQTLRREKRMITALVAPLPGRVVHWRGKTYPAGNRRELQRIVSRALDIIYNKAPHVKNEMINRDNPSAQATAARNKFLSALRGNPGAKNLGIEKYPPEKALYLSLLERTKLHRKGAKGWQFVPPQEADDEHNFYPAWSRIDAFLESTKDTERSFSELDDELCAPPYGIKRGMLEIFYALAIFANENEIAVYEDGVYQPFFNEPHLERFLAQPSTFAFKRVRIGVIGANILRAYQDILCDKNSKGGKMLAVTKPLARHVGELPEYAKNTKRISGAAQGFCRAVMNARSPFDMLMNDIPAALGFSREGIATEAGRGKFAAALSAAMAELSDALPKMKGGFAGLLAQGADLPPGAGLAKVREVLGGRVAGLESYTLDREGLGAFFGRVRAADGADDIWLDRILVFLSGSNPGKWHDADADAAENKLAEYIRRMRSLETLRAGAGKGGGKGVAFVRLVRDGKEYEETVRPLAKGKTGKAHQSARAAVDKLPEAERLPFLLDMLQSALDDKRGK